MLKRMIAVAVFLSIITGLFFALADEPRIYDMCGMFSEDEKTEMQQLISLFAEVYRYDAVIVTSTDAEPNTEGNDNTSMYADELYSYNGFGYGDRKSGFLYLIDMKNHVSHLTCAGEMIGIITDQRKQEILNAAEVYLHQNRFGQATLAVLHRIQEFLSAELTGTQSSSPVLPITESLPAAGIFRTYETWACPRCGSINKYTYCGICGTRKEEWTCTCGAINVTPYCPNCGKPKP